MADETSPDGGAMQPESPILIFPETTTDRRVGLTSGATTDNYDLAEMEVEPQGFEESLFLVRREPVVVVPLHALVALSVDVLLGVLQDDCTGCADRLTRAIGNALPPEVLPVSKWLSRPGTDDDELAAVRASLERAYPPAGEPDALQALIRRQVGAFSCGSHRVALGSNAASILRRNGRTHCPIVLPAIDWHEDELVLLAILTLGSSAIGEVTALRPWHARFLASAYLAKTGVKLSERLLDNSLVLRTGDADVEEDDHETGRSPRLSAARDQGQEGDGQEVMTQSGGGGSILERFDAAVGSAPPVTSDHVDLVVAEIRRRAGLT